MAENNSIPTEKDFNLSKVKLLPNGGIKTTYQITQVIENESCLVDRDETSNREIHPDLRNLFEDLRIIVARVFGITSFLTLCESKEMGMSDKQKALATNLADELKSKIDVRGIALSGTEDHIGVVITSVLETPNGLKTCIKTPRIKVGTISFGFEEELEKIIDDIKRELYAFLFKGKQAQMSLFGQEQE